jgi:hypothetical protein
MAHAIENMKRALRTFEERNKVYGDNYLTFGPIMEKLFPNGLTLKTAEDFNRFGILFPLLTKITRYLNNPMKGHIDSIHDIGVYAFMLEQLDSTAEDAAIQASCEHVWPAGAVFCPNCWTPRPQQANDPRGH